jgi:hypothetical protein
MSVKQSPIIRPLPTPADVCNWADEIITPEHADATGKRLIDLIFAIASPESEEQWELANEAAKHIYTKTMDFDENFKQFAGIPVFKKAFTITKPQEFESTQ